MPIIGDPLPDATESFFINLTNPSVNTAIADSQAVGTILPAVPIPNVTIANAAVTEGNSGTTNMVFTVGLSSASSQQVILAYATANSGAGDSATAGSDYTATSGSITFAPGVTQQFITVSVNGDTTLEPSETFNVNLTLVSGTIGTLQTPAVGTINNDDGPPVVEIDNTTVTGSPNSTVDAVFTVTLSTTISSQVTVSYATADGTAEAGIDYLPQSGIVTFLPGGSLMQTITVPVLASAIAQPDETFFVNLSSPTGGATDRQRARPWVRSCGRDSRSAMRACWKATQAPPMRCSRWRCRKRKKDEVTVQYNTADGTATVSNGDYVSASGTLTFAPGTTVQTVTVAVTGDTTVEPNETFTVNLTNATGAALFTNSATGTILNDDGQKALIELRLADDSGVEFSGGETLNVNDNFQLHVYVQDIQDDPNGIAAAYLDVLYDSNLVMVNGPIVFGAAFGDAAIGQHGDSGFDRRSGRVPIESARQSRRRSVAVQHQSEGARRGPGQLHCRPGRSGRTRRARIHVRLAGSLGVDQFVNDSINIGSNVFTIDSVTHAEGNAGGDELRVHDHPNIAERQHGLGGVCHEQRHRREPARTIRQHLAR